MSSAPATGADLHDASAADDHGHHGCATIAALAASDQLGVTVGTEHVDDGVLGDFELRGCLEAAIEAGQGQPAVLVFKGDRHADGWVAVDEVARIHQAVVAAGAADLDRKNSLIRFDRDLVQAFAAVIEDLLDHRGPHLREVVAVHDHHRAQGACAQAVDRLQGEFPVRRRLARVDSELLLEFLGDPRPPLDVAGRTEADFYGVFTWRMK